MTDDYLREQQAYFALRNPRMAKIFLFLNKSFIDEKRPFITTEQVQRTFDLKEGNYTWNVLQVFVDLGLLERVRPPGRKMNIYTPKGVEEYPRFVSHAQEVLKLRGKKK